MAKVEQKLMTSYQRAIQNILPSGCHWHFATATPPSFKLYSQERAYTSKMSDKRLATFRAGRHCAHNALQSMGVESFPLLVGDKGAPLWPPQIVGSISHCENACIAVAGYCEQLSGIGVDVESSAPVGDDLLPLICTDQELETISRSATVGAQAKIIFSIKESLFKCLFPIVHQWIDFKDVSISLLPATQSYSIDLGLEFKKLIAKDALRGAWSVEDDYIFTSSWYPNAQ